MTKNDHDVLVRVETKVTTLCAKVDKIATKVEQGFEENNKAHLDIVKEAGKKPSWGHIISMAGLILLLFGVLLAHHTTDISEVRAELCKPGQEVVQLYKGHK